MENGITGRGEGTGVYYLDETGESLLAQAETVKQVLERGADRGQLQDLLPAGGARNAIDCALWDLEIKQSGKNVWALTGIQPHDIITVNTMNFGDPKDMAIAAIALDSSKIKVKLDADMPLERIQAVCAARPEAEIVVDVNQGWTFKQLVEFAPKFKALGVSVIEQPLPRGADAELKGYQSPITLCADESCLDTNELEQVADHYQMVNIKLDKTGGLTEALNLAHQAQAKGLQLMVGNFAGTSLAMAPGFVIAQLCQLVDLDGALALEKDRVNPMSYAGGIVSAPTSDLWG
jgi:L-alanine-DL-glutamate epimerase-like enolase superfamily enzyme